MQKEASVPSEPPAKPGRGCRLCGHARSRLIERVAVADLEHEYRRQFGVEVRSEFPPGTDFIELVRCQQCGLEYYDPAVAGSAGFYAALGRSRQYYSTRRWEFTETVERLPDQPDLVDVGCGDGFFLSLIGGARKRGLELNPDAVTRARARGLDVREGLLDRLPDRSTDFLTLFQVLEHVSEPAAVLLDAARVLRPGGRLFVAVPNNDAYIGHALHDPLNAPPHHPLRWRAEALQYVPRVAPLDLEELLLEPLAMEHLHPYRRTRFLLAVAWLLRRRLPLHRVSGTMVFLRRLANVWTAVSMKVSRGRPTEPGTGFSVMAIYRRRTE